MRDGYFEKNIIGRVCEKQAYEVIPYYMNPYLWHPDVEVVVIALEISGIDKIIKISGIVNEIIRKIQEKFNRRDIKENDLKEALKEIIEEIKKIMEGIEKEKVKDLEEKVEELKKKVEELGIGEPRQIEEIDKIIEEIKKIIEKIKKEKVEELGEKVKELKRKVEDLRKKVEELAKENKNEAQTGKIGELRQIIDKIKVKEKTIEEIMEKIEKLKQLEVDINNSQNLDSTVEEVLNFIPQFELIATLEKILISILNPELNKDKKDILERIY